MAIGDLALQDEQSKEEQQTVPRTHRTTNNDGSPHPIIDGKSLAPSEAAIGRSEVAEALNASNPHTTTTIRLR